MLQLPRETYDHDIRLYTLGENGDPPHIWVCNNLHETCTCSIEIYEPVRAYDLALGGVLSPSVRLIFSIRGDEKAHLLDLELLDADLERALGPPLSFTNR